MLLVTYREVVQDLKKGLAIYSRSKSASLSIKQLLHNIKKWFRHMRNNENPFRHNNWNGFFVLIGYNWYFSLFMSGTDFCRRSYIK